MSREFRIPTQEEIAKRNGLIIGLPQVLLTDSPCQVYPRVSTPEQKENVSAEMQQDRKFALRCGWPDNDDIIIVENDDLGLSGQLRMEDRPAFVKMLRNIANGKVKTVIVANISRFFRRKWNDEAEKFMQICDTYEVRVVVPNASRTAIKFVYDFSQRAHVEQFRRECEEAWNYLENHIYGTMHAAMDELGRAGFWTGGNLPIGYIVDRREKIDEKKNPNYLRFILYEPHAKVIRWLFARYWELYASTLTLRNGHQGTVL
jgi:DNA invertase Pin-like site-specific DNA recombinase